MAPPHPPPLAKLPASSLREAPRQAIPAGCPAPHPPPPGSGSALGSRLGPSAGSRAQTGSKPWREAGSPARGDGDERAAAWVGAGRLPSALGLGQALTTPPLWVEAVAREVDGHSATKASVPDEKDDTFKTFLHVGRRPVLLTPRPGRKAEGAWPGAAVASRSVPPRVALSQRPRSCPRARPSVTWQRSPSTPHWSWGCSLLDVAWEALEKGSQCLFPV